MLSYTTSHLSKKILYIRLIHHVGKCPERKEIVETKGELHKKKK